MLVVYRSLLKIFGYAAKQACKQLQCIKAKLPELAYINGLHLHRALGYASQIKYTTQLLNGFSFLVNFSVLFWVVR